MMRQYKFRGIPVGHKMFVYGDLMTNYVHHNGPTIVVGGCVYHEVVPETVGQFIGIHDVNDRPVYTGDMIILKWRNNVNSQRASTRVTKGEVVYYEKLAAYTVMEENQSSFTQLMSVSDYEWSIEITGTKWDTYCWNGMYFSTGEYVNIKTESGGWFNGACIHNITLNEITIHIYDGAKNNVLGQITIPWSEVKEFELATEKT